MPRLSSFCSSLITSRASPTSSFRSGLPLPMSKFGVSAMLCLQIMTFSGSKKAVPCESFIVSQPACFDRVATPRARETSWGGVSRGPSRSSMTSPGRVRRSSLLSRSKASCNGTSSSHMYSGLPHFSRKLVPWFPRKVTQPSLCSCKARHRARWRPVCSSCFSASKTSTTSPAVSFLRVLLSLTSKHEVIAMSLTHRMYCLNKQWMDSLPTPAA
mmetsp:Transcript_104816/g.321041  ORF Transcript_104816/g.321041 Transcript_104816/m.321041 type:complete len:214 (+) Transcript_104816:389-1030(+)